jgi:hypothetical protein
MVIIKAMVITNHKRYNTKAVIDKIIWFILLGLKRVWG